MKSIEVFRSSLEDAMFDLENVVKEFQIVSVDTEFPGFLCDTPRDAGEDEIYRDLKVNVDNLKLIQLGVTLSNAAGCVGGMWQFNFCNFDPNRDAHDPSSIPFLNKSGIDLDRNRREGIDVHVFARRFVDIFSRRRRLRLVEGEEDNLQWVTFHGLYDLAYIIKLVTNRPLPPSLSGFIRVAGSLFGDAIYDVKHMARYCKGLLGGELGLDRLAKILKVERFGESHQAGSDSLLTASVFSRINQQYQFAQQIARGFLYGIGVQIKKTSAVLLLPPPGRVIVLPFQPPQYYHHHVGPRRPPSYYPPQLPAYHPLPSPCPPHYMYACNFAF